MSEYLLLELGLPAGWFVEGQWEPEHDQGLSTLKWELPKEARLVPAQLVDAMKANPGARPAELARSIGVSANQVHGLIAKLRADKLIVKKGKGYAVKS